MFKREIPITKIKDNKKLEKFDTVLIEKSFTLFVNSHGLVNIVCLPKDLKELGVGFLFSLGIIESKEDLKDVDVDFEKGRIEIMLMKHVDFNIEQIRLNPISRVTSTDTGLTTPWRDILRDVLDKRIPLQFSDEDYVLHNSIIFSAIKQMQEKTKLFKATGGAHGAAIFDIEGNLLTIKEDIGRHNAIDKVIGDFILREISFRRTFLTSTGRLTGDSLLKAIMAEFPVFASVSAAVESGINLAFDYGITLIGFVRESRMNIYTHPNRINI
ncbi:MAG: formate dehydrogenase accessory sulfurtransferase FdhD [Promethearchaeota archaeon]|nr:MAG: formate dehydrogenase accessory sulfurtransferase FdhD [Candidatus Lokiarchaeota archaeon]